MGVPGKISFYLRCPECEKALEIRKGRAGERYAVCTHKKCRNFEKEFLVPTAELFTRLLKTHGGEEK